MTGKTQTFVAKSLGPFGAVLGLGLAGTVSIYCPTGQLMQGEYFYSRLNKRSAANVLLQNSYGKQICFLHWQYICIYLFTLFWHILYQTAGPVDKNFYLLDQMFVPITLSVHPGQIIVYL